MIEILEIHFFMKLKRQILNVSAMIVLKNKIKNYPDVIQPVIAQEAESIQLEPPSLEFVVFIV